VTCRVRRFERLHYVATFLRLVFALIAPAAHADTWTVDNTGDPASGAAANRAAGNASTCSLREPPVAALPPRRRAPAAATERFAAAFSASAAHL